MAQIDPAPSEIVAPRRPWPVFLVGILLFVLGVVAHVIQLRFKNFAVPWFLPILGTAGVALMIVSLFRRLGLVRAVLVALFLLLNVGEWHFLLFATKTPAYTGTAQPGRKVPEFRAQRAGGEPFTEKDLESGSSTVLVFFRGRW